MTFIETMRWFGEKDPVSLMDIRQAGCSGVVTALHQVAVGEIWSEAEIRKRIDLIEAENHRYTPLHWVVVESLPVHEDIKKGLPSREIYIKNYQQSLINLAKCGIEIVCYNFMPVLDWSRTDINFTMPDGSKALRFVWNDFALFDLKILKRPNAIHEYDEETIHAVEEKWRTISEEEIKRLTDTVLLGLPGSEEAFQLSNFQALLNNYQHIDAEKLTENLHYFIQQVAPVAEEVGIRLCIHPDDPPRPLLGLPRVVSNEKHLSALMQACNLRANGITFCTGSLGVSADNDLVEIIKKHGDRIHFVHLRTTKREEDTRNFHEADHLAGDVDMYAVVEALAQEALKRREKGMKDAKIPMRPDHGHQMLDDLQKKTYPGYSAIGRLRGLAEIRGLELAISRNL